MNDLGVFALILLAGMTFPLAFWIARICLEGVLWVANLKPRRNS